MSASSSSSSSSSETTTASSTCTTFYVQAKLGYFSGLFPVDKEETIRVFKERIAASLNKHKHMPEINLPHSITADSFQLRRCDVADVVLEDTQLVGEHLSYKYITQSVYVLLYKEDGSVSEIFVPPFGAPTSFTQVQRDELKAKTDAKIQAEYEAVLNNTQK